MKYKAIIFDMDGTIVDTESLWQQATKETIINRGYPLTEQEHETLKHACAGSGMIKSCQLIKELIDTPDSIEILMKEKIAIVNVLYAKGIRFVDGFTDFHKKVRAVPLSIAVATNASIHVMELTNKSLNLSQYFGPHLYTINHVHNMGKPHPAIYRYAASQLGIDPTECIAIEDSAHGIAAAKGAGMFCIGINTSKKPAQIKDAHLKIDHYDEINLEELLKK